MAEMYLVKFYKRIIRSERDLSSECDLSEENKKSSIFDRYDYIAWDSFDGIRVKRVKGFEKIPNDALSMELSMDKENNARDDLDAFINERQKICLYDLNELVKNKSGKDYYYGDKAMGDGALFSDIKSDIQEENNADLTTKPLIVFTMLRFECNGQAMENWDCNMGDSAARALREISVSLKLTKLTFRVYGTLIPGCVVAVFRSNRYSDVVRCLSALSQKRNPSDFPIIDFYSVFGLNKENVGNWAEEDIDIRIRMVAEPGLDLEAVRELLIDRSYIRFRKEKGNHGKAPCSIQCQFGRYDYSVYGRLKKQEKEEENIISLLLKLYDVPGIRLVSSALHFGSANNEASEKPNESEKQNDNKKQNDNEKQNDRQTINNYIKELTRIGKSLTGEDRPACTNVVESVERLIIRIGQTLRSENTCHLLDCHIDHILVFLDISSFLLLQKGTINKDCMDAIMMGIQAVNEVVNNVVIDFYYDFDRPQREGSFLGNVSVTLLAYQKFVNRLVEYYQKWFGLNERHHVIVAAYRGAEINISFLNHKIEYFTKQLEVELKELEDRHIDEEKILEYKKKIEDYTKNKVSVIYIPCSTLYSSYEVISELIHEVLHLCLPGMDEMIGVETDSPWWKPVCLEALVDIHTITTLKNLYSNGTEAPKAGFENAAIQYISCICKAHEYQKSNFMEGAVYYRIFLVYWYTFYWDLCSQTENPDSLAFKDYNEFLRQVVPEVGAQERRLFESLNVARLVSELNRYRQDDQEVYDKETFTEKHLSLSPKSIKSLVGQFKELVEKYNKYLKYLSGKQYLTDASNTPKDIDCGYHLPSLLSALPDPKADPKADPEADPELNLIHTLYYINDLPKQDQDQIEDGAGSDIIDQPQLPRPDEEVQKSKENEYRASVAGSELALVCSSKSTSDYSDLQDNRDNSGEKNSDSSSENLPFRSDEKTVITNKPTSFEHIDTVCTNSEGTVEMQKFLTDVAIEYLCGAPSPSAATSETDRIIGIINNLAAKKKFGITSANWDSSDLYAALEAHTGENSIIPESVGCQIRDCADNCVRELNHYQEVCRGNLFPDDHPNKADEPTVAEKYLNAYTNLLKAVYHCNADSQSNMTAWILKSIFRFGAIQDSSGNWSLSRTSPFVVSALYMHIQNLEAYRKCAEYEEVRKNETLLKMYARLFASNTIFRLRRYNIYATDEGRTVEMIRPGMDGSLCDVLNPKETGSILDIRPIRLLEKLLMNYQRWKIRNKKQESKEFSVTVVGNIRGSSGGVEERIEELIQTAADCLQGENANIVIDWYAPLYSFKGKRSFLKNSDGDLVRLDLHELSDEKYFDLAENSGSELAGLIRRHNLTFFLDCPQLYRQHEFVKKDTQNYYRNYISKEDTSFTEDFKKYNLENNLFNYGLINSLMTNISGQGCDPTAEYGKLIHRVDTRILQHIENTVKREKNEFRCVYLMLSSATALSDTDYNKRNIVREERYNSKSFDIIHLENGDAVQMEAQKEQKKPGGKGCIVLTLHQILKNIDRSLETDPEILKVFRKTTNEDGKYNAEEYSEIIRQLRGIVIGVNYQYGEYEHVKTTLSVCCDPILFKDISEDQTLTAQDKAEQCLDQRERIMELVKTVVGGAYEPCLMPRLEYLTLNPRYKVDYYTALFSAAKSVEDMMYLHLLRDREKVVTLEGGVTYDDNLKLMETEWYPARSCSDKQLYNTILFSCDQSHVNYDGRLALIWRIRDNDNPADSDKKQYVHRVIGNMIQVCQNFAYKYRELYGNLQELEDMSQGN